MEVPPKVTDRKRNGLSIVAVPPMENTLSHSSPRGVDQPFPVSDSLPVLGAIQKFLDIERSKLRRSILTVMGIFAFLVVSILVGGIYIGKGYYDQLEEKIAQRSGSVVKSVEANRDDLEKIRDGVAIDTEDLRNRITRGDRASLAIHSKMSKAGIRLESLSATVSELEIDEAMTVHDFTTKYRFLTTQVDGLAMENELLRAELSSLREMGLRIDPEDVQRDDGLRIYMDPSNRAETVAWRLPIPTS